MVTKAIGKEQGEGPRVSLARLAVPGDRGPLIRHSFQTNIK